MHRQHGQERHTHSHPPQTEGVLIRWASHYDLAVNFMTLGQAAKLRQRSAELAQIQAGDRVLDVGCGTGELTLAAKTKAGEAGVVIGLDPSPEMIGVARQKAKQRGSTIDYRVGVIEAMPFADNSFDVVVSSLMMHHLPDAVKTQGLVEIQRVLRPNGHLLIVDMKAPDSFYSKFIITLMLHGGMQAGLAELPAKVASAGFHNISVGSLKWLALGYVSAQANKA